LKQSDGRVMRLMSRVIDSYPICRTFQSKTR